jgi:hypothetical protein
MAVKKTTSEVTDTSSDTNAAGVVDPILGADRPVHYPPAVVISDKYGSSVKTPVVTPEEFDSKITPRDATINDSEFVIHARNAEEARRLTKEAEGDFPKEVQEKRADMESPVSAEARKDEQSK